MKREKGTLFITILLATCFILMGCYEIEPEPEDIIHIEANDMAFSCREAGVENEELVVLLHGFPETSYMWKGLMRDISEEGYRCLAPDQRGYSPGARPLEVDQYDVGLLASDVVALADAIVGQEGKFHLVGHDWGAIVGWFVALLYPDRLSSWTALSVPHPAAFLTARTNDKLIDPDGQALKSIYMGLLLKRPFPNPENVLTALNYSGLKAGWSSQSQDEMDEYLRVFRVRFPGAVSDEDNGLTASLNYYRKLEIDINNYPSGHYIFNKVSTSTMMIWSPGDNYVAESGILMTPDYMTGPYQLMVYDDTDSEGQYTCSHWIMQDNYDKARDDIISHINAN